MPLLSADISAAPPVDHAAVVWAALIALAVAASGAVLGVLLGRWRQGLPVVPRREHEPVPWNGFDVLQVLVLHFVVLSLGLSGIRATDGPGKLIPLDLLAKLVATAFAIAYLLARGASLADLGLAPLRPAEDLRIACAGVALLVAPLLALAGLLNILVPYAHPLVDFMRTHRDPWSIAVVAASAIVAAPLAEEFFFRRVLQGWLQNRLPDHDARAAVAVTAALFAFAHVGQGLAFVPLLPLGIVLGVIAQRTGSIVPCILLHAFFNAVSVALLVWQTAPLPAPT